MGKMKVLIEVEQGGSGIRGFEFHAAAAFDPQGSSEKALAALSGFGIEVENAAPVPMFGDAGVRGFSAMAANGAFDAEVGTIVVAAEMPASKVAELSAQQGYTVWPNSEIALSGAVSALDVFGAGQDGGNAFDLADSGGGVDTRPFRPGVAIDVIRSLLGVERAWSEGFRGQNVVVGIIDEGVNGNAYPVVGGYDKPEWPRRPGTALVTSHGSMCAADILVAAPAARFYDYPFLGVPDSFGALKMFQAVLEQRRIDGTPHITNNSYGYYSIPTQQMLPSHEVWDSNHPIHRKVGEVTAAGVVVLFAAGNCGQPCPASYCRPSSVGAGCSIHGCAALKEVITVAAVNSRHERIGYSSHGPSLNANGFYRDKPDLAGYSHFFGNFGPDRPGGTAQPFDNGTSAATPVVAGVVALLLSAFPGVSPSDIKSALLRTAIDLDKPGYDHQTGFGVVNAAAAYEHLRRSGPAAFPVRANRMGDTY